MTLTPEQEQQIADELFKRVVPLFIDSLRRAGSEQGRASTPAVGGGRDLSDSFQEARNYLSTTGLIDFHFQKLRDAFCDYEGMRAEVVAAMHKAVEVVAAVQAAAPPAPAEPATHSAPVVQGEAVTADARQLLEWFGEAGGFKQGTAAPHKWVLQAESELRRLADMIDATPPAARTAEPTHWYWEHYAPSNVRLSDGISTSKIQPTNNAFPLDRKGEIWAQTRVTPLYSAPQAPTQGEDARGAELEAHQVYARVLCRAMDAATDFAGTVAGGASWWDDVWAEHATELDKARQAIDAARAAQAQGNKT